jgi:hypothetical protein
MPPKKPIRRTNKKKKGARAGESNGGTQPMSMTNNNRPREPLGAIPNFQSNSSSTPPPAAAGGLYGVYKRATQRFKDGLAERVPPEIFAYDRVQSIMDAVDYVVEQKIAISSVLLEDCRISLSFRKKYAKRITGGDEGHEYFILVLNYCFQSLKPLVPRVQRKALKAKAEQVHFTDLQLSDSEEDEEDDQDLVTTVRKPERPKDPSHDYTFEDLLKGTDRLQACVFLDSVDRAMEGISVAYKSLKGNLRRLEIEEPQEAAYLIEDIMQAALLQISAFGTSSCWRRKSNSTILTFLLSIECLPVSFWLLTLIC